MRARPAREQERLELASIVRQALEAFQAESRPSGADIHLKATPIEGRWNRGELATLARHAFGLAQSFNHFYHRQPILQEPDAAIRNRRLAITRIFRREMARLLALLGVPEPGRM